MTKNELKSIIKECVQEVLTDSQQPQEVYTINEMMERGMLDNVPEIEISDSEYNRIMNESVEVDDVESLL